MTDMLQEPVERDAGFWSTGTGVGAPATWRFEGEEGLARLNGPGSFSAPAGDAFRAKLTRVQLDHVALEAFAATPHRYERTEAHVREYATPLLTFVLVAEGGIHLEGPRGSFDIERGGCCIIDSRQPVAYSAAAAVRMLRTMVGIEHIPPGLQRRGTSLDGPLPRTALVDGTIAFASSLLRASAAGRPTDGVHLVRAVADLQVALLAEAQEAASRRPVEDSLRHRIEDHIDRHLADPDLGPLTIASALGISVRHAHGTFNEDELTIGRAIRERRLTAVATELQVLREPPDADDLSARYGFTNASALQRAFRARYGMSMSDYHRSGHRQLD